MTIIPEFDRGLPIRLKSLLSYQRREPIHIRLVSQHIFDFDINGVNIFQILRRLKTKKNARITLILDRKRYRDSKQEIKDEIQKLEDVGVNFHTIRNLHAKIITVENNQEKCLLITSANLSHHAYFVAHEVGVYFHNYETIFDSFKKYITNLIRTQYQ